MSWGALWALMVVTWRERLLRPMFGTLCFVVCASQVSFALAMRELVDPTMVLVLLIAGGSVGKDVSSGVLPLLFTRPLVRGRYILAKWLALGSAISVLSVATLLVQAAWLAHRGNGLPGAEVSAQVLESVTTAFGDTSVLLFFSVLVPGFSDVLLWLGLRLLPALAHRYIPQRALIEWRAFMNPALDWGATFGAVPIGWFRIFSYLSTVTLFLCLAVVAVNRKELSYASG
jgi:hypothetical protein